MKKGKTRLLFLVLFGQEIPISGQLLVVRNTPNFTVFVKELILSPHILCNLHNLNIFNNILFLFYTLYKTNIPNVSKSQLSSAHSANSVSIFIFLPFAIAIYTFMCFFLKKLSIARGQI